MRQPRRPAYSLIYILAALPLVATVWTISIQVVHRALRLERAALLDTDNDLRLRAFLAQFQHDARLAEAVAVEHTDSGERLHLTAAGLDVRYAFVGDTVVRTPSAAPQEDDVQEWTFAKAEVQFRIEHIDGGGSLAWLTVAYRLEVTRGLERARRLSFAAMIGGEDAS